DRNELQSDKPTEEILALGELEAKLRSFGWHVESCDGHDHDALARALGDMQGAPEDMPKVLVARTIKGRGVSFMEHPVALREGGGSSWSSTRTSPPIAGSAPSSSNSRRGSSRLESRSRISCRWPPASRGRDCFRWSTPSRASWLPARTSRSTTRRPKARR